MKLLVTRTHPDARIPTKAYEGDAGFDLYSIHDKELPPGCQVEIDCGIKIAIPQGYFGLILTRSSYGRQLLQVHHGVIDEGYRGPITVLMYNLSKRLVHIKKGSKVAQLIILPVKHFEWEETSELPSSQRGSKGFGSSGK